MLGRNAALRLAFVALLTLPAAGPSLAADLEPQDVRSTPPSRVLQTAPARTAQMQVCVREVPDLSRSNAGSAAAVLSKVNLALGNTQLQKSNAPRGTIVGQSVKPGSQVRCGTRIDVFVSDGSPDIRQTGPGGVDVRRPVPTTTSDGPPTNSENNSRRPIPPDVDVRRPLPGGTDRQPPPADVCAAPGLVNHSYVEVRERLRGWTIGRVERVETRAAQEGTILKQAPAPRTMVKCHSSIDIVIAVVPLIVIPPPPPTCEVPDMRGVDVALARRSLDAANLRIGTIETGEFDRPRGTIVSQSLKPFSRVVCGATVNLQVSTTAPPCVVPAIASSDVAEARQALARRNLVLGRVNRRPSETSPGTVIGQHPAGETTIACGSTVDVWIAEPLPLVYVPPLQGQDVATARRILEGVGLVLGTAERRESELPVGGVVDQLPLPETAIKPGTAVNVWLSAGVPPIPIPDLRGLDRRAASETLRGKRLRLGAVEERFVDAAPGTIVDQQPQLGTPVRRDTMVRVWVAALIEVPSVIGRREGDAGAILTNQRLRVGTVQTRQSAEPAGTVIDQRPQPRQPIRPNASVDLVVAVPITVVVPDLRGSNRQAASAALTNVQLQLGEMTTREAEGSAGVVVEQSPRAGESVELGTAVQVWVAAPIRVQVPDLRGSTRDDSTALLRTRRLVLGAVESRTSVAVPGSIVDQQPAAGSRVDLGTPVAIWVAAPAPPEVIPPQVAALLEVPDLKGRTRDEALAIVADRGLVLGQASTTLSNDTPDTVVSQQPAGAARVPPGTGVDVVLASPPVPPPGAGVVAPPPVTVPPDPPPMPLVWLLLGAGLVAAVAGITVKAKTRAPGEPRDLAPSITLAPHPDPQITVDLSAADGPFTRSELWLRPFRDAGSQTAEGPLGMIEVTEMR